MKIDCSKTLNYAKECTRMCNSFINCRDCPFKNEECTFEGVTQKHIDIVQKWSDEHPQETTVETMAEHFFKMFPKAPKSPSGEPKFCPRFIGWEDDTKCGLLYGCDKCWNREYKENNDG